MSTTKSPSNIILSVARMTACQKKVLIDLFEIIPSFSTIVLLDRILEVFLVIKNKTEPQTIFCCNWKYDQDPPFQENLILQQWLYGFNGKQVQIDLFFLVLHGVQISTYKQFLSWRLLLSLLIRIVIICLKFYWRLLFLIAIVFIFIFSYYVLY